MELDFELLKELIERAKAGKLTEEDQDLIDLLGDFLAGSDSNSTNF